MIQWPWVSRGRLDEVIRERDYLREQIRGHDEYLQKQVTQLQEHRQRMDRGEHGLGEVQRKPRPVIDPMPDTLLEKLNAFANPSICKARRDKAIKRRVMDDVPWAEIEAELDAEEGHKDPETVEVESGS